MALTLNLSGPAPWGFRINGGRDFKTAITVSKVNAGSKAEQANLKAGDIILEINGENTEDMLNVEAQNKIKKSKTTLQLVVERPEPPSPQQSNGISTPEQLTGRFQEAVIVSRDENQNYREYKISSPTSMSPGPYSSYSTASPDRRGERLTPTLNKSVQLRSWSPEEKNNRVSRPQSQEFFPSDFRQPSGSSRTPTPPERYSPHSPTDRDVPMSPRRRTPIPPERYSPHSPTDRDVPMSPRRSSSSSDFAMQRFDRDSEVYKMIQENKESRAAPRQSNTFKMLQEVLEADEKEAALRFPGKLSPNAPKQSSSVGGVSKQHTCEKCGTSIVTQAVRISDNCFRHPECYTCTDCGLNLKMRGHFWSGDAMYCEKHAKERYQSLANSIQTTVSPRQ
ncbi:PDZ and LIM domain protein 2 isoform X2 [Cyprinodon tularosa]|uniref:PDZ and LIM domain protein 2-like isoform X2 n=1 Tax=Cyprinodon variegatus TaxID=28743 RepID=UPI0007426FF5|nr:PREDICTED: PDZ and LIM domain protein 2-like isoform X2 [Cyprinodon variegatus]XP_038141680.1 PDZ and LIM domain protein 2 isoform X2 [Cyprinodon tularosa]